MERKIGEVFEYDGKKLRVIEEPFDTCDGCYFNGKVCQEASILNIIGNCGCIILRKDKINIIFKEVKDMDEENNKSILAEAEEIVNGNRQSDYGDAANNFRRIANIVNSMYPQLNINAQQCCAVLMAVKLIREGFRHKRDNLVDLCGYAHIMNEINDRKNE